MNPIAHLAAAEMTRFFIPCAIIMMAFAFTIIVLTFAKRYQKVGPDEVLIVSGRRYMFVDEHGKTLTRGFRVLTGGGVIVLPMIEQASRLSLKPLSFELSLKKVPARNGRSVDLEAMVQVRIESELKSVMKAAQAFLGKNEGEVKETALQILESVARSIIGARLAEEICRSPTALAELLQEGAGSRLAELGLKILSLSVREVR